MGTSYDQFMGEIAQEAVREGDQAVEAYQALDAHFAMGANLLRRRRDLNLTQEALAERCGVSQTEISRIERGLTNPTMATVSRLAQAMGGQGVDFHWA